MRLYLLGDTLAGTWDQWDWRENPLAPDMAILQAKTAKGDCFSGIGDSREIALAKCLGETAELAGVHDGQMARPYCGRSDGIASHGDPHIAGQRAELEMIERNAIVAWWQGRCDMMPIPVTSPSCAAIGQMIKAARHGATQERETAFYGLSPFAGMWVIVAVSHDKRRQKTVVGYGVAPDQHDAMQAAFYEMMLMEIGLFDGLAAKPWYAAWQDHIWERLAASCTPPRTAPHAQGLRGWLGCDFARHMLTSTGSEISVWICQPHHTVHTDPSSSPFL